jgi:hypothetical protein
LQPFDFWDIERDGEARPEIVQAAQQAMADAMREDQ